MSKFKHSLSVIVPVYNEEKILNDTIENLYYSLQKFSSDFEILIIENGSIDNTYKIAKSLESGFPNIKTVHYVAPQVWIWRQGRVKKINFGSKTMSIKKNIPARQRSFFARFRPILAKVKGQKTLSPAYWAIQSWKKYI